MVSKCCNPSCPQLFLHLTEGRLFRLEPDLALDAHSDPVSDRSGKVEYFWLCGNCSHSMTLRLNEEGNVTVEATAPTTPGSSKNVAIISRHHGMLLRTVGVGRTP